MGAYVWRTIAGFQERVNGWSDKEAGGLLQWARADVDSLHYLADLDELVITANWSWGHGLQVVDNAHPKWAATTAMSAVDRCAAALARLHGLKSLPGGREYSVSDLASGTDPPQQHLPTGGQVWLDAVRGDHRFSILKRARDPFVHGRLPRVVMVGNTGWASQRDSVRLPDKRQIEIEVGVGELVQHARDFATEHVERFLDAVVAGDLSPS